jgi:hypothetical protein
VQQTWTMKSSRGRQTALAIGSSAVGLVLMVGFRHFHGDSNMLAGFLLGVLLLVIGAAGLLVSGTQTVVVDPVLRRIVVEDKTVLSGAKRREIAFGEVTGISIGYLGKKSSFVQTYYLVLRLTNGQEYSLFAPGRFYPGANSRAAVETWRQRLQGYMTV